MDSALSRRRTGERVSIASPTKVRFGKQLRAWYRRNARDLPWRKTRDPYEVLVSELMLQQKGIPYKRTDLLPVISKGALRVVGFSGVTVPALKIDGHKVQGSRQIARELERLRPEPALFPADPEQRATVEDRLPRPSSMHRVLLKGSHEGSSTSSRSRDAVQKIDRRR